FQDAVAAIEPAARLLADENLERRFVAAHFLTQLNLQPARLAVLPAMDDADLRVAWTVFEHVAYGYDYYNDNYEEKCGVPDLFERLERLLVRLPAKPKEQEPLIWPWLKITVERERVAGRLVNCLSRRSPKRLIPYIAMMEAYSRSETIEALGKLKKWDAETRDTLFAFVGDTTEYVRNEALRALKKCEVTPQEAFGLEKLLTRKAAGLRRGILGLLGKMPDAYVFASADRLLAVTNPQQRMAGLELLQEMVKANRQQDACRERIRRYTASQKKPSDTESRLIAAILDEQREVPTLDNALGLMSPAERTPVIPPRATANAVFVSEAAIACLKSLNKLLDKHKETEIHVTVWGEERDQLLGDLHYGFPEPEASTPLEADLPRLPLREIWETWWHERKPELRDLDGCELLRLLASIDHKQNSYYNAYQINDIKNQAWFKETIARLYIPLTDAQVKRQSVVQPILKWLLRIHPPQAGGDLVLDAVETLCASAPKEVIKPPLGNARVYHVVWLSNEGLMAWQTVALQFRELCPSAWQERHHRHIWRLLHWMDEPTPGAPRNRPELEDLLDAYRLKEASETDLLDQLLGPRPENPYGHRGFENLHRLTGRKPSALFAEFPILKTLVECCRARIIEVELDRGDLPTAATPAAQALRASGDLGILAKVLPLLCKEGFARATAGGNTRPAIFSHLVQTSFPGPDDSFEAFATAMRAANIGTERLVELAVYAPQWAKHVEALVSWPELEEAVWWIHTHTKDSGWTVDKEILDEWTATSSERTPLTAQELLDGAVDVAWFQRVYAALGPERWKILDDAAKYASGGGGQKRAQMFANAMLGKVTRADLTRRILEKRYQDGLRALGLIPLGSDGDTPQQDVLARYKTIQEFLRQTRQFGSQRQASEKLAAGIAMQNLARTSGYADPNRLEWAMEAEAVADLAHGPLTVSAEDVAVTLAINALGKPELTVTKAGKPLKAIPPKIKKLPDVAELADRKTDIERQASRMRLSLESAMIRGDRFTGEELWELLRHPVLAPMLRSLIFVGSDIAGYPIEGGRRLESHDGSHAPVTADTLLAIAHPYDLLHTNAWPQWQRECFLHERIQPFKQVFRELYVLTDAEQVDGAMTRRYEGHQVQPKQALAILGQRDWVAKPDDGVRRTYHEAGLTAFLEFEEGYFTPTEVEGLTLARAGFVKRGEWKPIPLSEVPPRLFSETMRDLDLIVSVAHMGGVDPEASRSTTEMREALVRETCDLLKLTNVRYRGVHALIDGHLGTYTVHLGSAVVHIQPGGHLCIVPVPSQHRGRLFLPFADDDPKTAEVISKVILLAKDRDIQDPTILEQILPRK
ncbi:MAG TPA: DUF5724 domain-containing protein, partial [Chthonomonadaceae bacterium]|nr:DUF5724 domain-containing protein [Chthonomonadaceae bacterium]